MAKKVDKSTPDLVSKAFGEYTMCKNMEEGIRVFIGRLKGRIESVRLLPVNKGVSEIVQISFPDNSECRFTRFLSDDNTNVSLTRVK